MFGHSATILKKIRPKNFLREFGFSMFSITDKRFASLQSPFFGFLWTETFYFFRKLL